MSVYMCVGRDIPVVNTRFSHPLLSLCFVYPCTLKMQRRVRRSVSRHSDNLRDIKEILVQKLREAFEKKHSCQLDCQARLGKLVWLGELIERGQSDIPGMLLRQFEGPPRYEDRRPFLKYEYITRYIATCRNMYSNI